ncbi:MAG: sulfotransferase [Deltaproteobacteria bacterium]|nr:sulfotransferase [Deltaproteobacteria bacterium]
MSKALHAIPGPLRYALRCWRSELVHGLEETQQLWRGRPMGAGTVLLILGCQRSGTTLMTRIFAADPEAKVYGEYSEFSVQDRRGRLRLAPLRHVAGRLERSRFPLLVMKPLVESQQADELLATLPRSKALWLVRGPADVARSDLELFGRANGVRNLERLLAGRPGDWRGERVSPDVREVVAKHYTPSMDPMDAAALFWWARNSLFFELGLDDRSDVLPVRYESLATRPHETMRAVYAFAGREFPGEAATREVTSASVGRESNSRLSDAVQVLCLSMLERFDELIERRQACA